MNSSILIVTYLLKDILRGWIETPGALVARLLVATSLCLIVLFLNAGFQLAERAIEEKVEALGVNTVIVKVFRDSLERPTPRLADILLPLQDSGVFLPVELTFVRATLPNGQKAQVAVYDAAALPGFNSIIDGFGQLENAVFLANQRYPATSSVRVNVEGHVMSAEVVEVPSVFRYLSRGTPVLFVPAVLGSAFVEKPVQEVVLYLANDTDNLSSEIEVISSLVGSSGYNRSDVMSPLQWVGELKQLREMKVRGQAAAGSFLVVLIVLVFGSISVFEYRQNVFTTSLIKSFGISGFVLAIRYLVEINFVLIVSFLFAAYIGRTSHSSVFGLIGFANEAHLAVAKSSYDLAQNMNLLIALGASSIAGALPICLALRRSVGRVLA